MRQLTSILNEVATYVLWFDVLIHEPLSSLKAFSVSSAQLNGTSIKLAVERFRYILEFENFNGGFSLSIIPSLIRIIDFSDVLCILPSVIDLAAAWTIKK